MTARPNGSDTIARLRTLLEASEDAHGIYETAELDGVYDEDWSRWYAAYAVEHGIAAILGRDVTRDGLAAFLASTFVEFREVVSSDESWAAYTARRIAGEL